MAGSWGCPHETDDRCGKVNNLPCDPGMKGCVLHGRFVFANEDKNERLRQKKAREEAAGRRRRHRIRSLVRSTMRIASMATSQAPSWHRPAICARS
jgi:hypothetical protein